MAEEHIGHQDAIPSTSSTSVNLSKVDAGHQDAIPSTSSTFSRYWSNDFYNSLKEVDEVDEVDGKRLGRQKTHVNLKDRLTENIEVDGR